MLSALLFNCSFEGGVNSRRYSVPWGENYLTRVNMMYSSYINRHFTCEMGRVLTPKDTISYPIHYDMSPRKMHMKSNNF